MVGTLFFFTNCLRQYTSASFHLCACSNLRIGDMSLVILTKLSLCSQVGGGDSIDGCSKASSKCMCSCMSEQRTGEGREGGRIMSSRPPLLFPPQTAWKQIGEFFLLPFHKKRFKGTRAQTRTHTKTHAEQKFVPSSNSCIHAVFWPGRKRGLSSLFEEGAF